MWDASLLLTLGKKRENGENRKKREQKAKNRMIFRNPLFSEAEYKG